MSPLLTGLAVTAGTTTFLLWVLERHAAALGLMDVPNDRSSHSRPTPRGGGIAIVVGSLLGGGVFGAMEGAAITPAVVAGLVAASLVALISLVDDIRPLPAVFRLVTHLAAAALVILWLPLPTSVDLPIIGEVALGPVASVLAVLWIVANTNIYNFMDGIDGLAGGQGVVAGSAIGALGWIGGAPLVVGIGLAIAGSCLIFLTRNWSPAAIFMGDTGSAFLGFTLAALPFFLVSGEVARRAPVAVAAALWPFLFDAGFTLVRRACDRENILQAHRSHLYQRLVRSGLTHSRVSRMYAGLAAVGAVAGVRWASGRGPGALVIFAPVAGALLLLWWTWKRESPSSLT